MGHNQICRFLVSSPKARSPGEKPFGGGHGEKLRSCFSPDTPPGTRVSGVPACSNGGSRDPEREGGAGCFSSSWGPRLSQSFVLLSFPYLSSLSSYMAAPVIPYPALQLRSWGIGGTRQGRGVWRIFSIYNISIYYETLAKIFVL